jgi:stage III sporulation protein AG
MVKMVLKDFFRDKDKAGLLKVIVALVLGVLLISFARFRLNTNSKTTEQEQQALNESASNGPTETDYTLVLEKRMETALSQIDGAGKVKVLLTLTQGKELVVAEDKTTNQDINEETDGAGGTRKTQSLIEEHTLVLYTDENGVEVPLILREVSPVIEGAVIIAEGGENIFVKDALTRAAETVLGLTADKVQVFKMKK